MRAFLRPALVLIALFTLVTGLGYPLAVTGVAGLVFPHRAHGSLIEQDGRVVGSALIGQSFARPEYLHGRPSANGYDAANSGGSNLAPSSRALAAQVADRVAAVRAENPGEAGPVPVDLVTASASGLDPDVSPAAALYQARRIAAARGVPEAEVRAMVAEFTRGRDFGVLGEPRVNVLEFNLALDARRPMR